MPASPFFRLLVVTLTALQFAGPGFIWAMEQRGVEVRRHNQAVVSGIRGSDLTVSAGETARPVRFSEQILFGEQVRTARDSSAEVLINNHAVVTLLSESDVMLEEREGHTVVHLTKGSVLVSAAASALRDGQTVIVETPGAQLATRGGLLKATVGTEPQQTERKQEPEGRALLVSYTPVYPVQTEAILNERFEVYEGPATIGTRAVGATPFVVESGQSVQVTGGTLGTPSGIEGALAGTGPMLLAATHHAATPQAGLDLVSERQMQQVSALQQALYGDPDTTVEGKESQSGTIISTLFGTNPTQTSNSSNSNNPTASLFGTGNPYTAALLSAINRAGTGIGDDGNDSNTSLNARALTSEITVPGGFGLVSITKGADGTRSQFKGTELVFIDSGAREFAPHGGLAPLSSLVSRGIRDRLQFQLPKVSTFVPSGLTEIQLDAEPIRIVDTKLLTFQPYEIRILSLTPGTSTESPQGVFELTNIGTNQKSILRTNIFASLLDFGREPQRIGSATAFLEFDGLELRFSLDGKNQSISIGQRLSVSSITAKPIEVNGNIGVNISQDYRGFIDPLLSDGSLGKLPTIIARSPTDNRPVVNDSLSTNFPGPAEGAILGDFSSRSDRKVCANCDSFSTANGFFEPRSQGIGTSPFSFVDARLTARSDSDPLSPVKLSGGIVLADATDVTVTNAITRGAYPYHFGDPEPLPAPSGTLSYFEHQSARPELQGSVAAIVAVGERPAFVEVEDRIVAVLSGSSIRPDIVNNEELRISLVSVLDSQLRGPNSSTSSLVGATQIEDFSTGTGRLESGQLIPNRAKGEIPPLLEVNDSTVKVSSAAVVRATESGIGRFVLDRALLDASSPILTVTNSQFTATGHLIDLAGTGPSKELLRANLVPGDALVRLNGKTMDVAGNFLNLARTGATVNGYLFSLANAGTLNIGGTLLSLTGNSVFRLNSDAFGIFDQTANTLRLTNTLCASGECGLLTDHLNAPFQSSNGKAIQVAGSKTNIQLPQGFTPFRAPAGTTSTVVLDEHAALLRIEPGSELRISVPVAKK
ncbi:MAG: hypothetical protein GDA65_18085 [Nitrospira sp. CR1.1]|nr:hypothetical protein [Nitrospira sp. CR1.1]